MNTFRKFLAVSVCLFSVTVARAETVVTINRNGPDEAAGNFHFKEVPVPRRTAAIGAGFSVVDGTRDPNGGSPDVLHNGDLPGEEDQPTANFFFWGEGGRIAVDLGAIVPVKEVDTYSWHSDVRAPQVYKLYGSSGESESFNAKPARPLDPATAGWKLLATVDTRTKYGQAGGQYGVSVADPASTLGRFRYLLFDVARATADSPFGNTFFSEIAVVNADTADNPAIVAKVPAAKETSSYDEKGLHLAFASDAPAFDPKLKERLVQTFFKVYPEMSAVFNPQDPKQATIFIDSRYHGAAMTMGNVIHIDPRWYARNPEDLDLITHEAMHIVQQYHHPSPVWLMEGIADYARYKFGVHNDVSGWALPNYQPDQKYTDSYRVTARFLAWLEKHVKPGIVVVLDRTLRDGSYTADTWKQQTGKSVDELWQDYGKNPAL